MIHFSCQKRFYDTHEDDNMNRRMIKALKTNMFML